MIEIKNLETNRLILKIPTMEEQYLLWQILMIPEINKYYLVIPKKYKDNLYDWKKQKPYYQEKVNNALNNYVWSIFLKDNNKCIGQIDSHIISDNIYDLGWYIDPVYQRCGYATEAALAMLKFMFEEVGINGYKTSAAICNEASWKLMEKLNFKRDKETIFNEYTFMEEPVESFVYSLFK